MTSLSRARDYWLRRRSRVRAEFEGRVRRLTIESLENRCLLAEIRGVQWDDLDLDGLRDLNEPGKAGVTLFLDTDGDRTLDGGEVTTTSVADNPGTPGIDETG